LEALGTVRLTVCLSSSDKIEGIAAACKGYQRGLSDFVVVFLGCLRQESEVS
jgi:hypothetical protein